LIWRHCISGSKAVYPMHDTTMFEGGGCSSSEVKIWLFSRYTIGQDHLGKWIRFTKKSYLGRWNYSDPSSSQSSKLVGFNGSIAIWRKSSNWDFQVAKIDNDIRFDQFASCRNEFTGIGSVFVDIYRFTSCFLN